MTSTKPVGSGRKQVRPVPENTGKKRGRSAAQTAKKQPRRLRPTSDDAGRKQNGGVGDNSPSITPSRRDPTPAEAKAIEAAKVSHAGFPGRPAYSQEPDDTPGTLALRSQHADDVGQTHLAMQTLASSSDDFVNAGITHLANMTTNGGNPNVAGLNAQLALVAAIAPQDELEAALALQMASVHECSLDLLRRAKNATTRDGMRDYANLATKMTRTFTAQLKALGDHRRGGEQVVRHFHVYQFGPGVVAENINVGVGQHGTGTFNPHEQYGQGASCAPVFGAHSAGFPLPVPGHAGPHALSPSWGNNAGSGCAEGQQEQMGSRGAVGGTSGEDEAAAGAASPGGKGAA